MPSSVRLILNLLQNNGYVYQIADSFPNTGSYAWTVPSNYSGTGFKIYIAAMGSDQFTWWGYVPAMSNSFSISPAQSGAITATPTGICQVRNNSTSVVAFSAPDLGTGYAKLAKSGVNTISGLRSVCTQSDYNTLLTNYCVSNSSPVQQEVVTYDSQGHSLSTGGGPFGDNPVSCPTAPTTPPITVTYPNGGETIDLYGYNYTTRYQLNGVSNVGFKLLKGSQVVYSNGVPVTGNDTSISLNPVTYFTSVGSGSDYKIRVFDWNNPTTYDDSDSFFSIPTPDIAPPVVSSVSASSITANSAVITWTTDEPALGYVNYGSAPENAPSGSDWTITPYDNSWAAYITSHSYTLSNLKSNTLYTFRVYNNDAKGNSAVLSTGYPPEHTFTTTGNAISSGPGNSSLNVSRLFVGQYDNTRYLVTLNDPDGMGDIEIDKAGGGILSVGSPRGGNPPCPTTMNTGTVTLQPSDFPLKGWVIDCVHTGVKYNVEATQPSLASSLDLRTSNLSAVYYTLESLKAIMEKLLKLLQ